MMQGTTQTAQTAQVANFFSTDTISQEGVREVKTFANFGTLIKRNGKYGLLDMKGDVLVPCAMDSLEVIPDLGYCYTGRGRFRGLYSDEFGYIPAIYDNIVACGKRCEVVYHGMPGFLNEEKKFFYSKEVQLGAPSLTLKEELIQDLKRIQRQDDLNLLGEEYMIKDRFSQVNYEKSGSYVIRLYGNRSCDLFGVKRKLN